MPDDIPIWRKIFMDDGNPKPSSTAGSSFLEKVFMNPPPRSPIKERPCSTNPRPDSFFWAMHDVPIPAATRHLLAIGSPGSGKSVSIDLFLQSIAHRFSPATMAGTPERLVLLDVKGTYYSFLTSIGIPPDDIVIADPFDERCTRWNIAEDIASNAAAERLAALIIPSEEKASTSYFWQSARLVVANVIMALNTIKPGTWTLRDLIHSLATPDTIRRVVSREPSALDEVSVFLADTDHFPAVHTTIKSRLTRLKTVAALWDRIPPERSFSVQRWLTGHGVLLLGHRPKYLESINPINALLLRMIADEIQSWPDVRAPHTWIVLDEFRWMKEVESMAELLGLGRSKGASILLGIQDISGMRVAFGQDRTEEILGLCENKTFLNIGNPETAEWASKYFAQREATETKTSHTYGKEDSVTHSKDVVSRAVYMPGEFLDLAKPEAIPGSRFEGIHDVPVVGGAFSTDEDAMTVIAMVRRPSPEHIRAFPNQRNRPPKDENLTPWNPEERRAVLGDDPAPPPPPPGDAPPGDPPPKPSPPKPDNPYKAFLNTKLRKEP